MVHGKNDWMDISSRFDRDASRSYSQNFTKAG